MSSYPFITTDIYLHMVTSFEGGTASLDPSALSCEEIQKNAPGTCRLDKITIRLSSDTGTVIFPLDKLSSTDRYVGTMSTHT